MSTVGALKKKARKADSFIRSKIPGWPTYEQSKKASKKMNPGNVSATKTIGESVAKIISGPKNQMDKAKK
jgi:hypothetical protein